MRHFHPCLIPALLLVLQPVAGRAAEASPWSATTGAAIRLVPDASSPEQRRAGLQIRLDQGWKTYWRNPGDSGVPPVFDWSRSDNVAAVTVLWPAPHRLVDEDGTSIGYKTSTVLPLEVKPKDASRPATLALSLDYAICKTMCVPAKGDASLRLDPTGSSDAASDALLAAARAAVPTQKPLGTAAAPALTRITFDAAARPARLTIEVDASPEAELFVDGPADWYLPVPEPVAGGPGRRFTLALDGLPKSAAPSGKVLRFTLVDAAGSVETPYTLP